VYNKVKINHTKTINHRSQLYSLCVLHRHVLFSGRTRACTPTSRYLTRPDVVFCLLFGLRSGSGFVRCFPFPFRFHVATPVVEQCDTGKTRNGRSKNCTVENKKFPQFSRFQWHWRVPDTFEADRTLLPLSGVGDPHYRPAKNRSHFITTPP
jgi:hypothetical protein